MPVPHKPHTDMQTGRIRETHRDLSILITCSTYDRIIYLCLAHTAYFLSSNTPDSDIFSGNRKQVARILAHEDTGGWLVQLGDFFALHCGGLQAA